MQVVTPGHRYELAHHESGGVEVIQFYEKFASPAQEEVESEEMVVQNNGTTNEEVLAMMIDRMQYLDGKFPSSFNKTAITHLEQALAALNKRTEERQERGVEGKAQV